MFKLMQTMSVNVNSLVTQWLFVSTGYGICTCTVITADTYNCACDDCTGTYVVGGESIWPDNR